MIPTIPDKIPETILKNISTGEYDVVILFALGVFGYHKLAELVNDTSNSIENRLEKDLFIQCAEKLKNEGHIEEFQQDGEMCFRITPTGETELLDQVEPIAERLISTFEKWLGLIDIKKDIQSDSFSGFKLNYKDFIFGLLSLYWRTDSFFIGQEFAKIGPDKKVSLGKKLEQNAEIYENNIALLYEDQKFTYKEFNQGVNRFANLFLSLGVEKGEVINVFLENRPELMMIIGANSKIGTIGSLINTRQRSTTLHHSLKLNPVNIYVIGEELIDAFEEVKGELELNDKNILYFLDDKGEMETPAGYINLKEELKNQKVDNPPTTSERLGKETYVYIFTSGTTGLPKAAHIRNVHTMGSVLGWGKMVFNMQPDDIMYISLPMFHSNALHLGWASALACGSAVALARRFSVRNFWKDVIKFKATCFNYIGEICRYLLNQPPNPNDKKHYITKIGGNGLRPEIWKDFKKRFGIKEIYEHYGMTEMQGMFCNYLNIDCTIGMCLNPHAIVKFDIETNEPIRNEDGFLQNADPGEAGLFLMKIRDPYTFAGYTSETASKQKIFQSAFEEGDAWLYSGDMLRFIGYYHAQFIDRLGDTFRWKGENVSTSEVEDVIASFEQISHASTYGVEIPGTEGKAGMTSIKTSETIEKFNFQKLQDILNDHLPRYAIPLFIRFLSELPTTSTFKIQKSNMKKVGFDITKTSDPIYIQLPNNSEYVLLTKEIYKKIFSEEYRF